MASGEIKKETFCKNIGAICIDVGREKEVPECVTATKNEECRENMKMSSDEFSKELMNLTGKVTNVVDVYNSKFNRLLGGSKVIEELEHNTMIEDYTARKISMFFTKAKEIMAKLSDRESQLSNSESYNFPSTDENRADPFKKIEEDLAMFQAERDAFRTDSCIRQLNSCLESIISNHQGRERKTTQTVRTESNSSAGSTFLGEMSLSEIGRRAATSSPLPTIIVSADGNNTEDDRNSVENTSPPKFS